MSFISKFATTGVAFLMGVMAPSVAPKMSPMEIDVATTTEKAVVVEEVVLGRREEIILFIEEVFGPEDKEIAKRIAYCESSLIPGAKSSSSSATGLFQIIIGTWNAHSCEGDRTNHKDNTLCAKKIMSGPQGLGAWSESFPCWKKTFIVK